MTNKIIDTMNVSGKVYSLGEIIGLKMCPGQYAEILAFSPIGTIFVEMLSHKSQKEVYMWQIEKVEKQEA